MLLIGNARLITHNENAPYIENGCVAVQDGIIEAFGTTADLRSRYPDADWHDAKGRVVMPGLICAHTHIYSAFARGLAMPKKAPNRTFSDILRNQWWHIDKTLNEADNLYSAYATGLESVRYGVTTIFDHHASQSHVSGSLFAINKALEHIGLRRSLCYEVSDRDGQQAARQGIEENIAFIDYANSEPSGMVSGMFGLHASFTLSSDTLAACTKAMGTRGAGYHIHTAEGIEDVYDSLEKYGKRVVERLFDAGILGDKTLSIHNIHVTPAEMDLLAKTNTMAVHNPESNMGNAVGNTPILPMLERGILMGLGTDAYTHDMFESLKVTNIIHKHHLCDSNIGFGEALGMLFSANAAICERFFPRAVGVIREGAAADLAVIDYTPHTPMHADNLGGHIMFGIMGRSVDSTMINGKFIMLERKMQTVDEAQVLAECRSQSEDFWKRVLA